MMNETKETPRDKLIRALHFQLQVLMTLDDDVVMSESAKQFLDRPNDFCIEVHILDETNQVPSIGTSWSMNDQ